MDGSVVDLPDDAVRQQLGQPAVDGRVRLAQDERQFRRFDERHSAESVEQLPVGKGHASSVTIGRPGGQPTRVSASAEQISELIDDCTGTRYNQFMIRSFRHRGLRRLYERDDPSRIAANQLARIALALADLDAAGKPSDLDLPGYRLHPLRGNRRGLWSISIAGNWRITFRFEAGDVYDVDLVDYH